MPMAIKTAWFRDHAALPHPFIAGIEDEIGVGLLQVTVGELGEALVQALVDLADGRGGEAVAAELLGDRLHLARRDALHVHLRQSGPTRAFSER